MFVVHTVFAYIAPAFRNFLCAFTGAAVIAAATVDLGDIGKVGIKIDKRAVSPEINMDHPGACFALFC